MIETKPASPPQTPKKKLPPLGLQIIAVTKLLSAALLAAVGFGIIRLMGGDASQSLEVFIRHLHLDPDNAKITELIAKVSGISRRHLIAIDAGTFLYALLYVVEGIGLLLGKHWAEYLTIFATGSLVPFEVYEVVHKLTFLHVAVFLGNVAIVIYLVWRLEADHKAAKRPEPH